MGALWIAAGLVFAMFAGLYWRLGERDGMVYDKKLPNMTSGSITSQTVCLGESAEKVHRAADTEERLRRNQAAAIISVGKFSGSKH
jgi:hypothetical protein